MLRRMLWKVLRVMARKREVKQRSDLIRLRAWVAENMETPTPLIAWVERRGKEGEELDYMIQRFIYAHTRVFTSVAPHVITYTVSRRRRDHRLTPLPTWYYPAIEGTAFMSKAQILERLREVEEALEQGTFEEKYGYKIKHSSYADSLAAYAKKNPQVW